MKFSPTQAQAALILNALSGVGPVACAKIYTALGGDLAAAFSAPEKELARISELGRAAVEKILNWKRFFDLKKEEEKMAKSGVEFVPFFDAKFPKILLEIPNPPIGIYVRGNVAALQTRRAIGIVGTRKASLYGTTQATKIGKELALSRWAVVSGLARGIDTAAHVGTLEGNGVAIAVLGCGIDIVYPPENAALYRRIIETGGAVVSEFPFGKVADKRSFPQRNRIIAGLGAGMLVVESDERGGSMISAEFAADFGRTVFALPGRVDQVNSRGCHRLIREGATLITSADDIISEMESVAIQPSLALEFGSDNNAGAGRAESAHHQPETSATTILATLPPEAATIFKEFAGGDALSPDTISERTNLPSGTISSNLTLLEISRLLARRADGLYEKIFN